MAKPVSPYNSLFFRIWHSIEKPVCRDDIFRPELFIAFFLAFLLFGIRSASRYTAVIPASLLFFYAGAKLSPKLKLGKYSFSFLTPKRTLALAVLSILTGVFELALIGGTPLLKPGLFTDHHVIFTTIAFLSVPLAVIYLGLTGKEKLHISSALFTAVLVLMSLLGYRTEVVALLIAFFATAFYMKLLPQKVLYVGVALFVFSILGLGLLKAQSAGASELNVLTTRAETTLSVSNYLTEISGMTGVYHGRVHLSAFSTLLKTPGPKFGPRTLIANTIQARPGVTITSTLAGPLILDFGIAGSLVGFLLLGVILGRAHGAARTGMDYAVYSVLLAFALISIETGLIDGIVLIYYILGTVYFFRPRQCAHGLVV
ncbi:MAG: hypothetical protein ABH829_03900 [archaeon]